MADFAFIGNALGVGTMRAGDGDDARADAIFESGNLRRAGKPRADNSDTNDFLSQVCAPVMLQG
jgi:hypothetical protein